MNNRQCENARPPNEGGVQQTVTVWTDGSCSNNGTKYALAGSGLWYGAQSPRNRAIRLPGEYLTNNIAEVVAAVAAIQDNQDAQCLKIITDSVYALKSATDLLRKRVDHGFLGVANKAVIAALTAEISSARVKIWIKKVKGHAGDVGNENADRLAASGA
ncbi:ribonuclease H domain-containing protein, partial [Ephemerocybe angulata]